MRVSKKMMRVSEKRMRVSEFYKSMRVSKKGCVYQHACIKKGRDFFFFLDLSKIDMRFFSANYQPMTSSHSIVMSHLLHKFGIRVLEL